MKRILAVLLAVLLGMGMFIQVSAAEHASTDALTALLRRWGNNISVYYENINTGFVFRHNATRQYFGASVSKAVLGLMIAQMADRGEVNLNHTLALRESHRVGGIGTIQHNFYVGRRFTVRELLRLMPTISDNVATLVLTDFVGINNYRNFVRSLGGNPALVRDRVMNSQLTANEVGLFARAIHHYLESGSRHSAELRSHLRGNQFMLLGHLGAAYPMASRTGWTRDVGGSAGVVHDMAIVYAPGNPFILVVMTANRRHYMDWRNTGHNAQNFRDFNEILRAFEQFNRGLQQQSSAGDVLLSPFRATRDVLQQAIDVPRRWLRAFE
ncbi:MAG: class A beta-lactamase-related serine hydrolase [Oscillospiraceae bacterium]|nr:class A beta-lactamase-related serine hydrolase [Oscillospiraceae bacterium]